MRQWLLTGLRRLCWDVVVGELVVLVSTATTAGTCMELDGCFHCGECFGVAQLRSLLGGYLMWGVDICRSLPRATFCLLYAVW